jgi:hypothetical protein
VDNQVAKAAADAMVREVVAEHAKQLGAARRAEAERLAKEQRQAEEAQQQALAEAEAAQEALARSIAATEAAQEEERKRALEEAERARQELLAKQQAVARANAEAEAKRKAQERAEQQRREQEERARKAQAKLQQAGGRGSGRQRGADGECRAPRSLLRPEDGKEDPVQTAGILLDLIAGCKDPTAVVLNLVLKLDANREPKLSDGMRKVLHMARLALDADPKQLDKAILALTPKHAPAAAGAAA